MPCLGRTIWVRSLLFLKAVSPAAFPGRRGAAGPLLSVLVAETGPAVGLPDGGFGAAQQVAPNDRDSAPLGQAVGQHSSSGTLVVPVLSLSHFSRSSTSSLFTERPPRGIPAVAARTDPASLSPAPVNPAILQAPGQTS